MIPFKQLSGLHCHVISYVFISHNLSLSSSLWQRIGELVPLYYSHITQTDGRPTVGEQNFGKSGGRRPIVGRRRHRFWLIFWSADDFFVEAPKLKVSLTDPPIFIGFVIGETSGDDRPTVGRRFEEIFIMIFGQRSPDHRASIGRRSPDGRPMPFYQRIIGRQTPDIGRHSVDGRPTVGRS